MAISGANINWAGVAPTLLGTDVPNLRQKFQLYNTYIIWGNLWFRVYAVLHVMIALSFIRGFWLETEIKSENTTKTTAQTVYELMLDLYLI